MLQQTQVARVIPKYRAFVRRFPTVKKLAQAPLSEVFFVWQGLGYNRRAKLLRDGAREVAERFHGAFPRIAEQIEELPGVGPYTARAIAAFAFNTPDVFIETNIRTVFLHHCFPNRRKVPDAKILPLIAESLIRANMPPRDFYAALMDYGSYLKKTGVRLNAKSKHYARQTKFKGSRRELRGKILKLLLESRKSASALAKGSGRASLEVREELARLRKEKLVISQSGMFFLAD